MDWDRAWCVFQLNLGIRADLGMTACRMPLGNTYATTRSDLTSLTASTAVCY